MRAGALLAAALVTASPLAAHGGSPACRLVVDAERDDVAVPASGPGPTSSGPLDIVSADIAADRQHLTAVVRVRDLAALDPTTAYGADYNFSFTRGADRFTMTAGRTVDGGVRFWVSHSEPFAAVSGARIFAFVEGVFDDDASEVRVTAPRSAFADFGSFRAGQPLDDLVAETERTVGTAGHAGTPAPGGFTVSNGSDEARGDTAYAFGEPSCVSPGG